MRIDFSDGCVDLEQWEDKHPDHPILRATETHPNTITIDFSDNFEVLTAHATPTEARQLAAALVRLAGEIEGEGDVR